MEGVFVGIFLFMVLFGLMWLCCIISCIVKPNVDSSTKILWLLALIFIPGLGCLLYLLFGPRSSQAPQIVIQQTIPQQPVHANDNAESSPAAVIPTTTTYTIGQAQPQSSNRSAFVVAAALAIVGLIGIASFRTVGTTTTTTRYEVIQQIDSTGKVVPIGQRYPGTSGYTPDKDSASILRNIATLQEAHYADTGKYVSCKDNECNQIFGKVFNLKAVPAGYKVIIKSTEQNGEQGFTGQLWNDKRKNSYVEWNSLEYGLVY